MNVVARGGCDRESRNGARRNRPISSHKCARGGAHNGGSAPATSSTAARTRWVEHARCLYSIIYLGSGQVGRIVLRLAFLQNIASTTRSLCPIVLIRLGSLESRDWARWISYCYLLRSYLFLWKISFLFPSEAFNRMIEVAMAVFALISFHEFVRNKIQLHVYRFISAT